MQPAHVPQRTYLLALKRIHSSVLKKICAVMIKKDRYKYPTYMYNPDLLPKYNVIGDFSANTLRMSKEKDKKIRYLPEKIMF